MASPSVPVVAVISDALRYPVADEVGRGALLRCLIAVVLLVVGLRYAAALVPLVVGLVPALLAVVGLVLLLGTTAVLLADPAQRDWPSVRGLLRPGLAALALSIVGLAPPIGLLALSAMQTADSGTLEGGAGVLTLVSTTLLLFALLACAYAYPVAVAASVSNGRLRAAADTDVVMPVLADATYLLRWIVGFSLVLLGTWCALMTLQRGDASGILAAAAAAYFLVAGARTVGVGYADASGRSAVDSR
ncbi:DUF4013 domain-containing protein [Halopiger xanaduensis]|uniref:DUF4013 domain-containing protein n=1 Tax=Halopiger xanaduensis (strain DSM 18323 / JCM 14033 / SH-6) TaxID=797210 RepID=F8DAD0_HALXS|nr:DUF4013 domain-containing protein [Halopiger xanaduensis]AEH37946.1 hypothetical protein Halxa_3334 [Halopiger xanaduensis SH-6]